MSRLRDTGSADRPVPVRSRPVDSVWLRLGGVAAGLVVAAVLLWWAVVEAATARESADAREELRAVAPERVAALFSADAATWSADRARAREQVTDEFAITGGLAQPSAPPPGVRSIGWEPVITGEVEVRDDRGEVLMVVAVTTVASSGETGETRETVLVDLTRIDDRWLISGVDPL